MELKTAFSLPPTMLEAFTLRSNAVSVVHDQAFIPEILCRWHHGTNANMVRINSKSERAFSVFCTLANPLENKKKYFFKIFFRQDLKNISSSDNGDSWLYLTTFLRRDRLVSPKVALLDVFLVLH